MAGVQGSRDRMGGGEGRKDGAQDLELCSGRWEPLRVLSRGGAWSGSGVHRCALAPRACNRRNRDTRAEAIRLVEYLYHPVPRC